MKRHPAIIGRRLLKAASLVLLAGLLACGCGDGTSRGSDTEGAGPSAPEIPSAVKSIETNIHRQLIIAFSEPADRRAVIKAIKSAILDEDGSPVPWRRVRAAWRTTAQGEQLILRGPFKFGGTYTLRVPEALGADASANKSEAEVYTFSFPSNPSAYAARADQSGDLLIYSQSEMNALLVPFADLSGDGKVIQIRGRAACEEGVVCPWEDAAAKIK